MSAQGRGLLTGQLGVAQHGLSVAGDLGVVCDPSRLGLAVRRDDQRGQGATMERDRAVRRQNSLDRTAGNLVPEGDGVSARPKHARVDAALELAQLVGGQRLEQPQLGPLGNDGHRVQQGACPIGKARSARQHGVANAVGHRGVAGGEHLRDVERVAGRALVQGDRIDSVRSGEAGDGFGRQRREPQPGDVGPGQLAEHDPQRMRSLELVVAIRGDHERREGIASTAQQPDDVERRVVGPMQILEDDDGRGASPKLARERRNEVARGHTGLHHRRQLATELIADVDERPERARREQGFARATEDVDVQPATEDVDNRGLADSGLAGDQNHPAAPGSDNSVQLGREHAKLLGTLQQRFRINRDRPRARRRARVVHAAHAADCLRLRPLLRTSAPASGGAAGCRSGSRGDISSASRTRSASASRTDSARGPCRTAAREVTAPACALPSAVHRCSGGRRRRRRACVSAVRLGRQPRQQPHRPGRDAVVEHPGVPDAHGGPGLIVGAELARHRDRERRCGPPRSGQLDVADDGSW